ncbi:hypothetical protein L484_009806 [Morus notabilis]|uniref:Uncharacterized protein n=1 Tax=Morus notabilis TaxID=981085 RepID=W9S9E6_9ROSA|nr:uncharacterized protein LOC21393124 [Morus notabilis]EXC31956.1 hypothetical protein L484_009806 [Morus notabilis]
MSCLNLRLPTARKAWWRSLTSKIQSKLHKLNKPKSIVKPRNRPKTVPSRNSYKFLGARFKRKRSRLVQPRSPKRHLVLIGSSRQCHALEKSIAPVYVDKLFKESVSGRVDKLLQTLPPKSPGTSKEATGNGAERACAADDMWEAMGFASPQMHGIDERAEQFIAKFRAEMEVQEMLARDL